MKRIFLFLLLWLLIPVSFAATTVVQFNWDASVSGGAITYNVYCTEKLDAESEASSLTKLNPDLIDALIFDFAATEDVEYTCHVTAVAGKYESDPSESITFLIPASPTNFRTK